MSVFEAVKEFGAFPSAVALGLALWAVFDVFALIRAFVPVKGAALFVCDVLFMLMYWFFVFTLCVGAAGKVRYYIVAGVLIGSVCEHFLVGKFAVRTAQKTALRLKDLAKKHGKNADMDSMETSADLH